MRDGERGSGSGKAQRAHLERMTAMVGQLTAEVERYQQLVEEK